MHAVGRFGRERRKFIFSCSVNGSFQCFFFSNSVYQMSLLEMEDNGSGVPQGVVLAIVGPSSDATNATKETETARTARMYNLASLVNLARWTVSQKVLNFFFLRH